jgi:O-antigen/teichoic acid export membrane protein
VLAILTRTISQVELGRMFLAITISRLAAVVLSIGADSVLVRKVASDSENSLQYISQTLSLQVVSIVAGFLILNITFLMFYPDLILVMLLVSIYTFLDEIFYTFSSFFTGKKQINFRLFIMGTLKIAGVLLILVVAYKSQLLVWVLLCQVFLSCILVLVAIFATRKYFGEIHLKWEPNVKINLIKHSFPFLAMNVLGLIHMRFDTILIGGFLSLRDVALYEIGIKLLEVTRFLVRPFRTVFFPILSEYSANGDMKRLRLRFRQIIFFSFGIGSGLFILMLILGSWVIPLLFGEMYINSILVSKILFLSVPFLFTQFLANVFSTALHLEKEALYIAILTVVINIGLNLCIIPVHGIIGAAWVTVISQIFSALMLVFIVLRKLFRKSIDINLENLEDLV